MITLLITTGKQSRKVSFEQNEIFIGPKGSELCDIGIQGPSLSNPHCKIVNNEGRIVIFNLADDPEVLVDNLAFGRRTLVAGSKVSLYDTVIELAAAEEAPLPRMEPLEVERLLEEVESLGNIEPEEQPLPDELPAPPQKSKLRAALLSLGLLAALAITLSLFAYVRSQKPTQEMIAAASIADAAMALLSDLSAADRDALETRARALLHGEKLFLKMDSAGNLLNTPYSLTVIPAQDGKSATLIAAPQSTLLRKIAPLDTFFVDTSSMRLYKLSHLSSIDRLKDPKRLQLLASEAELLSLNTLSTYFPSRGFEPAQNARQIDSESTEYLYNAPRYSAFLSEKELIELPHAILYSGLGRTEAKELARSLAEESGSAVVVAYPFGNPYQGSLNYRAVRISAPKKEVAPPADNLAEKLSALKGARAAKLSSLAAHIQEALTSEIERPKVGARSKLRTLVKEFEQADSASQQEIKAALQALYLSEVKENKKLTADAFRQNLISQGFEGFLDNPR